MKKRQTAILLADAGRRPVRHSRLRVRRPAIAHFVRHATGVDADETQVPG